jgi:cyanophycinase
VLLVGGGEKPAEVMRLFVKLAGGPRAPIVVLPLASGDSRDAGGYYVDLFEEHGARNVKVIHVDDRRDALRRSHADAVRAAGGVWFGGGDQKIIVSRLVGTPLLEALHQMKKRGGVVGGTSAGTACQSETVITGGSGDHTSDAGDLTVLRAGNIAVGAGLGILRGVIVDQHFVARRRNNRLLSAVLEHPRQVGVGIDEGTAVWFRPDGTLEVLGKGWVLVYDARQARVRQVKGKLSAVGLRQHVLLSGQRLRLAPENRKRTSRPASQPASMPAQARVDP